VAREPSVAPPKVKRWRLWLLVTLASIVSAAMCFSCQALGTALLSLTKVESNGDFLDLAWRAGLQGFFALMAYAIAIGMTVHAGRQLGQFIGGSGIPELKCELGGVHLVGLFDIRVLIGKLAGLAFAIGAGLPVGCEGPFVHASACVSHNMMMAIPAFQDLMCVRQLRLMAVSTMVAVGVGCTFTAPLGGVLYALEVTDSFQSSNYVPCFFGATVAGLINISIRGMLSTDSPFYFEPLFKTDLKSIKLSQMEHIFLLAMYTLFGVVCGCCGALFVHMHRRWIKTVGFLVSRQENVPGLASQHVANTEEAGEDEPDDVPDVDLGTNAADAASAGTTAPIVVVAPPTNATGPYSSTVLQHVSSSMTVTTSTGDAPFGGMPSSKHRARFVSALSFGSEEEDIDEELPESHPSRQAQQASQTRLRQRKLYFGIVISLVGVANFFLLWLVPFLSKYRTQPKLLDALTSRNDLQWGVEHPSIHIFLCVVIKYITTTFVLALPLPMGSVAPAFVLGAIIGRAAGWLLKPVCTLSLMEGICSEPLQDEFLGRFALIGASAFVAGSMQSFAQVIVVFERTCLPEMLIPLCASALAAIFIAQCLSKNFFDSVIEMKKLPHLPALGQGREALNAEGIMRREIPIVPVNAGVSGLAEARARYPNWNYEVPIVDVPENMGRGITNGWGGEMKVSDRLVVVKSLLEMPCLGSEEEELLASGSAAAGVKFIMKDAAAPVVISHLTPLKVLLPMLTSLERNTAFVARQGYLVGAITMADLYTTACGQKIVSGLNAVDRRKTHAVHPGISWNPRCARKHNSSTGGDSESGCLEMTVAQAAPSGNTASPVPLLEQERDTDG